MPVFENSPPDRSRLLEVLCASAAGIAAFAFATQAGALPAKLLLAAFGAGFVFAGAIAFDCLRPVLLALWVFSLTYNRMYFVFEPLVGYQGGQGPYVILSDVFLFGLLALWAADLIIHKRLPKPIGSAMWPWLLPFVIAASVSVLQSPRPDWGFYELLRYLKFGMIVMYFRYQVGKREWWVCIAAIVFALLFLGSLSVAEIATGRSGLSGVLGLAKEIDAPEELRDEVFLGWHRATATMNHPPQLACYFIFMTPVAFALGFGTRHSRIRWVARAVGLIALAGLGCTMSRWPNTLMMIELALLISALTAMRLCTARQSIALASLALLTAGVVVFTFRDFIVDRLFRDLNRSIEFRKKEDGTGVAMAKDHPYFGVGLNNYFYYLLEYQPDWQWALKYEELAIRKQHIRPLAAPHSAYLSILAETGFVGMIAYAVLLIGILKTAVRAVRRTRGPWRAVATAFAMGLVGHYLQQIVDFSMLFDPLLYTMAMVMGLVNIAPDLNASVLRSAAARRTLAVAA